MWLLPTRGRLTLCQKALDACIETNMTSEGIILIDETSPGQYDNLEIPDNWTAYRMRLDLQATKQWIFKNYPNEKSYGVLFDDLRPRTKGWDRIMEEETRDWYLIDSNDLWIALGRTYDPAVSLCGAFCWGGELVRTVGWWGFPCVRQFCNDLAWCVLCIHRLKLRKRLDDVIIEHFNWRTGKRPKDETDNWVRDGEHYREKDKEIFRNWERSDEPKELCKRIRRAMENAGANELS